jgi:hypothetical protein
VSEAVEESGAPGVLPAGLAASGPSVIGATGGSGTRVVARMVREAGLYTGARLNDYEDALDFGEFSDRWIDRYLGAGRAPSASLASEMRADLREVVAGHCAGMPEGAASWGWKEPRSIYLLPFLRDEMPSLRFLHFVRDGRDMALSENQNQLKKHGAAVLAGERVGWRRPVRSIALWSRVNSWAADWGERELGSAYLRVRFEDLCAEPTATIAAILDFFGLDGDPVAAASLVAPPSTLGRWRDRSPRLVARLEGAGREGLARLGYR